MSEHKVSTPRVIFNLAVLLLVVVGIFGGIVYLIAPEFIPGTHGYDERIANQRAADRVRKAREEEDTRQIIAMGACQKAIRGRVKFPSRAKFDPGWLSIPAVMRVKDHPERLFVSGKVELMNGLGLMIPHKYQCVIERTVVLHASVKAN